MYIPVPATNPFGAFFSFGGLNKNNPNNNTISLKNSLT